jgi:hypothetical protein
MSCAPAPLPSDIMLRELPDDLDIFSRLSTLLAFMILLPVLTLRLTLAPTSMPLPINPFSKTIPH